MKVYLFGISLLLLTEGSTCFYTSGRNLKLPKATTTSSLYSHKEAGWVESITKGCVGFAAATTIFSGAFFSDLVCVQPASALELSTGAVVIQTSASTSGESLLKAEIDSKSLVKTIFANRKELASSIGRIQSVVANELSTPFWLELQKEILEIEGDVAPSVKISPPADWKRALQDVANGKLNLLVNGEIVNVLIEPNFSQTEDDLVIRVTGFKGERFSLPERAPPAPRYGPITSFIRQFEGFWSFWDQPFQYSPNGVQTTNGGILLTGTVGTIGLIYAGSYGYYTSVLESEAAEAEAKRNAKAKKAPKKKKQGEVAPPKKKQADGIKSKVLANTKVTKTEASDEERQNMVEQDNREKQEIEIETTVVAAAAAENGKRRRFRFRFWKKAS